MSSISPNASMIWASSAATTPAAQVWPSRPGKKVCLALTAPTVSNWNGEISKRRKLYWNAARDGKAGLAISSLMGQRS